MTEWIVLPVQGVTLETAGVLQDALNDVEREGWSVSDVLPMEGGVVIIAHRGDDTPDAPAHAIKLTPRQRLKAAGVPGCG